MVIGGQAALVKELIRSKRECLSAAEPGGKKVAESALLPVTILAPTDYSLL